MKSYPVKFIRVILTMLILAALSACGNRPPDEQIKDAINKAAGTSSYKVEEYKITNSYSQKIDSEDVQILKWEGTFKLLPELVQYLHSSGGISYKTLYQFRRGTIAVVKRGNEWYQLNAEQGVLDAAKTQEANSASEKEEARIAAEKVAYLQEQAKADSRIMDANAPITFSEKIGGVTTVTMDKNGLSINGKQETLKTNPKFLRMVHVYRSIEVIGAPGAVLFLMANVGGNESGCSASFFFMTVTKSGEVFSTPRFGTCATTLNSTVEKNYGSSYVITLEVTGDIQNHQYIFSGNRTLLEGMPNPNNTNDKTTGSFSIVGDEYFSNIAEKKINPSTETPTLPLRPLSDAAKEAIADGFVEIKNTSVQACTENKIEAIKKLRGKGAAVSYSEYNEAAVSCGFNI